MLILFSLHLQNFLCFISVTSPTNASSFQLTSISPILVSALAAFVGAIGGSIVSGYYMIRKVREEMRLEFFSDILDNFYDSFQDIIKTVIEKNEISAETSLNLKELIKDSKKWILLCPSIIKKSTSELSKHLNEGNHPEAIKSIKIIKKEIDKITAKFSLPR